MTAHANDTDRSPLGLCTALACAAALSLAPSLGHAQYTQHAQPTSEATAPSEGGDRAAAEALSGEAVEAFNDKRYDESIDLFEQAYALDPNPNYLFNIGRVYEEKGDLAQAVDRYQAFVSQPGVELEARDAATARLKVLREALKQLEDDEEEDDPPPPAPVQVEPAETQAEPERDEPANNSIRARRIAGYSLLGAGGLGLIVGGIVGGVASSNASDADDAEFIDEAESLRDDARRQARTADALLITGGVLGVAGLVLVLTTLGKNNRATAGTPRRFAVSPWGDPNSGGAVVRGRF